MKRIAIVNTSYKFCGVDSYVLNLLHLFSDQVQFFLFIRKNSDFEKIVREKYNNVVIKYISKNVIYSTHKFYSELKNDKIDTVHIQTASDYVLSLAVYWIRIKKKAISLLFTRHNSYDLKWFPNSFFLKICDIVITPSQYVAKKLLLKYPFVKSKCSLIYNSLYEVPADTEENSMQHRQNNQYKSAITMGFIGRISPKKGFHLLLKAVFELQNKVNAEILVKAAGDVSERIYKKYLLDLIRESKLGNKVELLGFISNKFQFYNNIDVLVIPSLINLEEAFGLTALEAMAYGKAVVCFPSGALPELVMNEYSGIICKDDTLESLIAGISQIINNPDLIKKYGNNGRKLFLEKFSIQQYYAAMKSVYEV